MRAYTIDELVILGYAFERDIDPYDCMSKDDLNDSPDFFIDFIKEKEKDGTIEYILFNSEKE